VSPVQVNGRQVDRWVAWVNEIRRQVASKIDSLADGNRYQ
jgi:hypothetical protein